MAVRVQVPPPAPKAFREAKGLAADVLQKRREPFSVSRRKAPPTKCPVHGCAMYTGGLTARRTVMRLGGGQWYLLSIVISVSRRARII